MMRVLLDTNILLDLVLDRQPFADHAESIWEACRVGRLDGYVLAVSPINVFYVVKKYKGAPQARRAVEEILNLFGLCVLDAEILETALALPVVDYEDATQLASALAYELDAIVTRDPKDFAGATLLTLSPVDLLTRLG